ncbi:MAG: hypothetical protein J6B68_12670 [Lachnospiraceae bacterium]|nr:hypothetical protein [Lachnospiraceae bacterium]
MKISFDNNNTNQNVDRVTTSYQDIRMTRNGQTDIFALDISGTVMDNNAYKGQGKTAEEVMQDAGQVDIAVQRDYMTVMSNSMSTEDFNEMMKDGYQPGDMEIEEVVTIVDKIKTELIKGGTQVAGYTDQIDEETLKEITGSEAFAQELCKQFKAHDVPVTEENVQDAKKAYGKAAAVQELTEGAAKYMVENHMEPTIDAIYRADFSSTADGSRQGKGYYADGVSGYYAKKADEFNWQQLQPQMEKVIEQAGLEISGETLENAKWLVEKGVPLTPEAVESYHQLSTLTFPQKMEDILSAIAAAISDGKKAGNANLADGRSNLEKAVSYVEKFAQITEEAVDKTVAEGKKLNLANLQAAQKQIVEEKAVANNKVVDNAAQQNGSVATMTINVNDTENFGNITARRQLEEVRLMMTIEANYKLIASGYSIDTAELEQLVESLKQIESNQKQLLFGEADVNKAAEKAALYTETRSKIEEIPYLPIDIAGRFKATAEDFTLNQVHIGGIALKNAYEQAQEKYETLMTAPRADMGDSIRKAFRNVDDILQDMNLELTEENRRAVRILGYNSMELTEENIQAVKESDLELRRVIEKMTPAATLQAIRDGQNPLEMSMAQLNEYLDSTQYSKEQENEKYSKFLYKLEKNNEITDSERDAYIGIYRMLRQIEKTDDAAIGTLLNNGAELSFKNLLSAVRSNKKHGMDYSVDDSFGGMESVLRNASITEQIESGFGNYVQNLAGETADKMADFEEPAMEKEYLNEQLQEYRQASQVDDSIVNELLNNKQPVTTNNLLAADMLMNSKGFLYRKLNEFIKSADKDKVKDAISHLQEAMVDKESMQEAYEELQQVYEEVLEESQEDSSNGYLDLKTIQSCHKQLALAGNLAKEENYQVPVEINGETTAIHLKVLHGNDESGKVKATLETESYGKVAAQFSVRNGKVSGYVACSTTEGTEILQGKEEKLQAEFKTQVESLVQSKLELGSIGVMYNKDLDLNTFEAAEGSSDAAVETADLYQIAKAFITVIKA